MKEVKGMKGMKKICAWGSDASRPFFNNPTDTKPGRRP
jgi:hypothetical protein